MPEQHEHYPRRARARTWGAERAAAGRGVSFADQLAAALRRLRTQCRDWAIAEVAPGRLLPWVAVAFGGGVVLYFTAEREPAWWATALLAVAAIAIAYAARRRSFGFPLALGFAAAAAGLAVPTIETAYLAHPILHEAASSAAISGFVAVREERERSDRIVVDVDHIEGRRLNASPQRVRLAVRKGTAPAVGSFVDLHARLSPPLAPLRPGGYDFARDMYFLQIGASGYALGAIKAANPPHAASLRLRYAAVVDAIRESVDKRIRAVIPGDEGSIASALITGKRDAISTPVNDAMYISSLAHVLSISGYPVGSVSRKGHERS